MGHSPLGVLLVPSGLYLGLGTANYPLCKLLEMVCSAWYHFPRGEVSGHRSVSHGWPVHC